MALPRFIFRQPPTGDGRTRQVNIYADDFSGTVIGQATVPWGITAVQNNGLWADEDGAWWSATPDGVGGESSSFEMPGMSRAEKKYLALLTEQIEESMRIQKEDNARAEERRATLEAFIQEKYGVTLSAHESKMALMAMDASKMELERYSQALEGKLEVDPAIESEIEKTEATTREKLLQQVGPGYETSTPGIESLAEREKRAAELRTAARHGIIEKGASPSAAAAQYGLNLIGKENVEDIDALRVALAGASAAGDRASRNAGIQATTLLGLREISSRERIAQMNASNALSVAQMGQTGAGGGWGNLAGQAAGGLIATIPWWQRMFTGGSSSSDPFSPYSPGSV